MRKNSSKVSILSKIFIKNKSKWENFVKGISRLKNTQIKEYPNEKIVKEEKTD